MPLLRLLVLSSSWVLRVAMPYLPSRMYNNLCNPEFDLCCLHPTVGETDHKDVTGADGLIERACGGERSASKSETYESGEALTWSRSITSATSALSTILLTATHSGSSRGDTVAARRPGVTLVASTTFLRAML